MTVALTYDNTLARVRIAVSGIGATADYARIERSTDQIRWTTVRGGTTLPLVSGAANLDDYEFVAGVANYYRVSAVDSSPITFVSAGTATTAVTPGAPAGFGTGDLLLIFASIRNSGGGTVNTPAGWTKVFESGNMALLGKRATSAAEPMPAVTYSGAVVGADTIAQCAAFRNADLTLATSAGQVNASAQNIAYPAVNLPDSGVCMALFLGWKQDDWTSVATIPGAATIGATAATAGDDSGQVWQRDTAPFSVGIASGSFVVTGGAAAISRGAVVALQPAAYLSQEGQSITPNMTEVWLKSLARPFLNRAVTVTDWSDITRPSRSGVFEVVGRAAPLVVSEVRGSRRWSMDVRAADLGEASQIDVMLTSGDLQFIHVPTDCAVPGGYVAVGDTTERRPTPRSTRRIFALPLTEVAAPAADVVGATITCQGVLNAYATCADVLAAHATCADLLELIGDPTDVIVS